MRKDITSSAVFRHSGGMVLIIGASNPDHVIENCIADRLNLSREEWYGLLSTAAEIQAQMGV
jgi:predicted oxidoreductase